MSERITLVVDDGIGDKLVALAGGERKRGRWISDTVRAAFDNQAVSQSSDLNTLRLAFAGLAGDVASLHGRVDKVEATTAALVAQGLDK
ncbi:MAG: hypothetical protein AAF702_37510 [Chloroflexota bacterium]